MQVTHLCVLVIFLVFFTCNVSSEYVGVESVVFYSDVRSIPISGMDQFTEQTPEFISTMSDALGMIGLSVSLVDENHQPFDVSTGYLHLITIRDAIQQEIVCPERDQWSIIASIGSNMDPISLDYPYGYEIQPNSEWQIDVQVVNPSNTDELTYSLQYEIRIANWTDDLTNVYGYFNSITGCLDSSWQFDITGSYCYTFLDFPMSFSGSFVWMTAHLHQGGKNLQFINRESGAVVYNGISSGQIGSMIESNYITTFVSMFSQYRIAAVYDCTSDHEDAMAVLFAYITLDELYEGEGSLVQHFGTQNPYPMYNNTVSPPKPSATKQPIPSNQNGDGEEDSEEGDTDIHVFGFFIGIGVALFCASIVFIIITAVAILQVSNRYRDETTEE